MSPSIRMNRSLGRRRLWLLALVPALVALGLMVPTASARAAAIACVPNFNYWQSSSVYLQSNCGASSHLVVSNVPIYMGLSPNGKFVAEYDATDSHLIVRAVDGSSSTDLGPVSVAPGWSPDSQWLAIPIALPLNSYTPSSYQLDIVHPDGTGRHTILNEQGGNVDFYPVWSPDGSKIATTHFGTAAQSSAINVLNADGSNFRALTQPFPGVEGVDGAVAWTPDSNYVVYTLYALSATQESALFVVGLYGGGSAQLPTANAFSSYNPTISRDWTLGYQTNTAGMSFVAQAINDSSTAKSISLPGAGYFEFRPTGKVMAAPVNWPPAGVNPAPDTWVDLADSYASGENAPGPNGYLPGTDVPGVNMCHRSIEANGPLASQKTRLAPIFSFHPCSGALIQDFYTPYATNHQDDHGVPLNPGETHPQMDWLDARTKILTLTVGGNNAFFADVMGYCATHDIFVGPSCEDVWGGPVQAALLLLSSSGTGGGHANLPDLYRDIRTKAPYAKVYVRGYPRFFPKGQNIACGTGVPGFFFSIPDMKWINNEIADLNEIISYTAASYGFVYVDEYDALDGHELCTSKPWISAVNLLVHQESFHPTVEGQAAMSRLLVQALRH